MHHRLSGVRRALSASLVLLAAAATALTLEPASADATKSSGANDSLSYAARRAKGVELEAKLKVSANYAREAIRLSEGKSADGTKVQALRQKAQETYRDAVDGLYECIEPAPNLAKPPPLPKPAYPGQKTRAEDFLQPPRLCPADEVTSFKIDSNQGPAPYPPDPSATDRSGSGQILPSSVADGLCDPSIGNVYRCYSTGRQFLPWQQGTYGLFTEMSEATPLLGPGNGHTLSQLWGVDNTPGYPGTTEEFGWRRYIGVNGAPSMFAYHFDANFGMGYASCDPPTGGFVCVNRTLVQINQPVANWYQHNLYGMQRFGTDWWFYYNGIWVGYIPASAFPAYFNYGWLYTEAGGEIADATPNPCSQMGNGIDAYPAPGGLDAATIASSVRYFVDNGSTWSTPSAFSSVVNSSHYPTGFFYGNPTAQAFRFGGVGFRPC